MVNPLKRFLFSGLLLLGHFILPGSSWASQGSAPAALAAGRPGQCQGLAGRAVLRQLWLPARPSLVGSSTMLPRQRLPPAALTATTQEGRSARGEEESVAYQDLLALLSVAFQAQQQHQVLGASSRNPMDQLLAEFADIKQEIEQEYEPQASIALRMAGLSMGAGSDMPGKTCADADNSLLLYDNRFHQLKRFFGMPNARGCNDFRGFCDMREYRELRSLCPLTCGCHTPYERLYLRTPRDGCPTGCLQLAKGSTVCADHQFSQQEWEALWDGVMADIVFSLEVESHLFPNGRTGIVQSVQTTFGGYKYYGCLALSDPKLQDLWVDPVTGKSLCEEGSAHVMPLAWYCPVACGCSSDPSKKGCPGSCQSPTCLDSNLPPIVQETFGADKVTCKAFDPTRDCVGTASYYCPLSCGVCNGTTVETRPP